MNFELQLRLARRYSVRVQHADQTVDELGDCATLPQAKAILAQAKLSEGDVPFVDDHERDQTSIWYGPEEGFGPWSQ